MSRSYSAHATPVRTVQGLSVQMGLAIRIGIFATAPQVLYDSWQSIDSSIGTLRVLDLGPAVILAALFAGFLEPLRDLIIGPGHHGANIRIGSFLLTVCLSVPLMLLHQPLHHALESNLDAPLALVLGQGLITFCAVLAWLAESAVVRLPLLVLAIAVPVIVGYDLQWSLDETWYTFGLCLLITILAVPCFRPWTRASMENSAAVVLLVGVAFLALILLVHALAASIPTLPAWLMHNGSLGPDRTWRTTWLEDVLFYGGWALGLFAHRGVVPRHGDREPDEADA